MKADNKSFDTKLSYLAVGGAAILRGAEPISASNGASSAVFQTKYDSKLQSAMATI